LAAAATVAASGESEMLPVPADPVTKKYARSSTAAASAKNHHVVRYQLPPSRTNLHVAGQVRCVLHGALNSAASRCV
jgi:hypothetical protein